MPQVSIIIPTYNRQQFLNEALDSVLSQSFQDFELIVVDDGSTDETATMLDNYRSRIIYLKQENSGPSAARNAGIKRAGGTYLAFLDADDLWLKHKLRTQMDIVNANPEIRICYTDEIWIRNGVRVNQKKLHQKYSGWIFQKCLPLCIISPSSVLIHRHVFEQVGLFDETLPVCEDYDLWLRASAVYPITFIAQPLIMKRGGHADQLSKKLWGMDRYRVQALEKIVTANVLNESDRAAAIQMLQKKCAILINGFQKRRELEEVNKYQLISERYL